MQNYTMLWNIPERDYSSTPEQILFDNLCSLFQDYNSVLVEGTCQIPDPLYKLIGSIVSFYIPLVVMLVTYALTVRLLALQQQNIGGCSSTGWSSGWLGGPASLGDNSVI